MATDISTLIVKVTSDGAKQTEAELKNLGNQAEKTANQTNKLEKATKQVNSGFKAMKGSTQQVSYQLQDIAIQSQMGTDAFIILGQQGPQLASIFGPRGAVLGVMIAFGAMIGGTLVRAFDDANVGADELEETLDRLSETTKRAENSTFELTKRIIELARANETAARVSLYADIADGTVVIQEQRQAIIDLANESLDFAGFSLSVRDLGRELDDLKDKDRTLEDLLSGTSWQGRTKMFADAIRDIGKEFQFTENQAFRYLEALGQLDKSDAASFDNLEKVIEQLGDETRVADREFRKFRQDLLDLKSPLDDTTERVALQTKALNLLAEGGAEALKPLMEGYIDAEKTLAQLDQERIARLLDADQKESAINRAKNDKLVKQTADRILKTEKMEAARFQQLLDQDIAESANNKKREDSKFAAAQDAAQKELQQIAVQGLGRLAAIDANAQIEIARKRAQRDQNLISDAEFYAVEAELLRQAEAEKTAITQREEQRRAYIREATQQMVLARASAVAGQLTSVLTDAFGEQSAAAKAAFLLQKGLAMAQIIVSTEVAAKAAGAQAAMLGGLPAFLASEAAVRAMGAISLGIVAGQTIAGLQGRALGGQVRGGESYLVGERGPELLTMGGSGRISSNDQLKAAMSSTNSSNETQVNVNFAIQANDTAGFDRLLQSRRGQIISMINQAVNDRGRVSIA
jgi:hypothetical protein